MGRAAYRTSNSIMKKCPYCRKYGKKELVEGPKRLNVVHLVLVILGTLTCCVPIFFLPFCWEVTLEAYCHNCEDSFQV